NKLTTKAQSLKAAKSSIAKNPKPAKIKTENYLIPLHEVTQCIKQDYAKLKKLFGTIPTKIEKALATAKTKLKKAKEAEIKSKKILAETQKKQKGSAPSKSSDLAKHEKTLKEQSILIEWLEPEIKALSEQLQTCKKMQSECALTEKAIQQAKK